MSDWDDINAAMRAVWSQPLPWHEGYVETPSSIPPLRLMWDQRDVVAVRESEANLEEAPEEVIRWRAAKDQHDAWLKARIEGIQAGFSPSELPPWRGYPLPSR